MGELIWVGSLACGFAMKSKLYSVCNAGRCAIGVDGFGGLFAEVAGRDAGATEADVLASCCWVSLDARVGGYLAQS